MNIELREAIEALEKEKNIKREALFEAIENALITACKNNFGKADNIRVAVDRDTFEYSCCAEKKVVETEDDVEDKLLEIPLAEAVKIDPEAEVGGTVDVKINSQSFGRDSIIAFAHALIARFPLRCPNSSLIRFMRSISTNMTVTGCPS